MLPCICIYMCIYVQVFLKMNQETLLLTIYLDYCIKIYYYYIIINDISIPFNNPSLLHHETICT